MVRMPKTLHAMLAASAADEGVSLNHYVVSLLSRRHEASTWERYLDTVAFTQRALTAAHHLYFRHIQSAWGGAAPSSVKATQQRMMTTGVNDAYVLIVTNQNHQPPAEIMPFTPAIQSLENYHG